MSFSVSDASADISMDHPASADQAAPSRRSYAPEPSNQKPLSPPQPGHVETCRKTTFPRQRRSSIPGIHSHPFYELIHFQSPGGYHFVAGSQRYALQTGDTILIPPGVCHGSQLASKSEEPYTRDVIWLSPEFLSAVSPHFFSFDPGRISAPILIPLTQPDRLLLSDLFSRGISYAQEQPPGWQAAVLGNTLIILTHLHPAAQALVRSLQKGDQQSLMDQVLLFIESNLSQRITLADVSKTFYVSESTISQLFRRKMGVSFYRCVTQRRLATAKRLIQSGIQLETVASQTGFTDYSTFFRAFKQEYGISPREYRKMLTPVE